MITLESPASDPQQVANPFVRSVAGDINGGASMVIEDLEGRKIELRAPGPLAPFHLVAAVGELARNQAYMTMVAPLLSVSSINGESVPVLDTKEKLEELITKLGNAGVQAVTVTVMGEIQRLMNPGPATAEPAIDAPSAAPSKDAGKKGHGKKEAASAA